MLFQSRVISTYSCSVETEEKSIGVVRVQAVEEDPDHVRGRVCESEAVCH